MTCPIIKINKTTRREWQRAGKIIKRGGLVAFPTETVYGLGANALDKKAVRKIFEVKGRPLDNPIIVHIADLQELSNLVKEIPKTAEILARKFWPGPLTLVLFKKPIVSDEVTAGSNTVAIRMPKNKIALELIKAAKVPIAAPSANLAGKPSPTEANHVFEDIGDRIDLILDGGRTEIGIESTVVDLTVKPAQVLRPGGVPFEELKKVIKDIQLHPSLWGKKFTPFRDKSLTGFKGKAKSPGMKYRHYAPRTPLILVEGNLNERIKKFRNLISLYRKQKKLVGVMISRETKKLLKEGDLILVIGSRKNLKEISRNLFQTLRKFDRIGVDPAPLRKRVGVKTRVSQKRCGVDVILAETFPEKGIGFALMHRLKRAAQT